MGRIHILVDEAEKSRYKLQAAREGKSLGAWLRDAAEERLRQAERHVRFESRAALDAFFDSCDGRELKPEPDWATQEAVIHESQVDGLADS